MTDVQKVRLLIGDNDSAAYVYQDAELQGYLDLRYGSVRLAAADALNAIANRLAREAKRETIGDWSYDTTSAPALLRQLAETLVTQENETPAWGVAQENLSDFNSHTIILNSFVRGL